MAPKALRGSGLCRFCYLVVVPILFFGWRVGIIQIALETAISGVYHYQNMCGERFPRWRVVRRIWHQDLVKTMDYHHVFSF